MAGRTGKVVRTTTNEKELATQAPGRTLGGVIKRRSEGHSARLGSNPGRECLEVGSLLAVAERLPSEHCRIKPLQGHHAMEQSGFQVHHTVGIGEPARQPRQGARNHTRPLAQIASLERNIARAARHLPEVFTTRFPELARAAVGDGFPVTLDLACRFLRRLGNDRCRAEREGKQAPQSRPPHRAARVRHSPLPHQYGDRPGYRPR